MRKRMWNIPPNIVKPTVTIPNLVNIHKHDRVKDYTIETECRIRGKAIDYSGRSDKKYINYSQPAFTCSKLTIETLEQGVKYVQS